MESTAGSSQVGAREASRTPHGRRVPLNSKRLTAAHLWQLAQALDLPVSGSPDETRQLIEGKLADREDCSIQVIVEDTLQTETVLWLVDSEGPFLQTVPSYKVSAGTHETEHV